MEDTQHPEASTQNIDASSQEVNDKQETPEVSNEKDCPTSPEASDEKDCPAKTEASDEKKCPGSPVYDEIGIVDNESSPATPEDDNNANGLKRSREEKEECPVKKTCNSNEKLVGACYYENGQPILTCYHKDILDTDIIKIIKQYEVGETPECELTKDSFYQLLTSNIEQLDIELEKAKEIECETRQKNLIEIINILKKYQLENLSSERFIELFVCRTANK